MCLDYQANDPAQRLSAGICKGDGDGTVPLLSLGYPAAAAWRDTRFNPAGEKGWRLQWSLLQTAVMGKSTCSQHTTMFTRDVKRRPIEQRLMQLHRTTTVPMRSQVAL